MELNCILKYLTGFYVRFQIDPAYRGELLRQAFTIDKKS